jgi:hypothetical protein
MQQIAALASLRYASAAALNALLEECHGSVLGFVRFSKPSRGCKDMASALPRRGFFGVRQNR